MDYDDHKTALTFKEKIKSAYLHYVRGVTQHELSTAYEVNIGRVNTACNVIKFVLDKELTLEQLEAAFGKRRATAMFTTKFTKGKGKKPLPLVAKFAEGGMVSFRRSENVEDRRRRRVPPEISQGTYSKGAPVPNVFETSGGLMTGLGPEDFADEPIGKLSREAGVDDIKHRRR